jgi:hypothetical protein
VIPEGASPAHGGWGWRGWQGWQSEPGARPRGADAARRGARTRCAPPVQGGGGGMRGGMVRKQSRAEKNRAGIQPADSSGASISGHPSQCHLPPLLLLLSPYLISPVLPSHFSKHTHANPSQCHLPPTPSMNPTKQIKQPGPVPSSWRAPVVL